MTKIFLALVTILLSANVFGGGTSIGNGSPLKLREGQQVVFLEDGTGDVPVRKILIYRGGRFIDPRSGEIRRASPHVCVDGQFETFQEGTDGTHPVTYVCKGGTFQRL